MEVIVLLAAGLGLWLFTTARAASNLTYYPGDISGLSFSGATFDLVVQNTSNVEFTIYSLAASVFSNDTLIGNISDFTPVIIPANNQVAIPLNVKFLALNIIDDLLSAFGTGSYTRTVTIKGTVNANGQQLPVGPITYSIGM